MGRDEDDEDVIEMNAVHRRASAWVQRVAASFKAVIDESGHPTGHSRYQEGHDMLKTISAALLAASVLVAAPAMAHGPGRTAHAPQTGVVHVNPGVLDANAWMGRHHHRPQYHHHHFRHHHRFHPHH
jgi:hypothetical protein